MKKHISLAQHTTSKSQAFCKKLGNRTMRRAARRDPESAPTKIAHLGWWF